MVDFLASSGPKDDQKVHDETGVDACSHNGNAVLLCALVKLLGKFRLLCLRISHLFCGSDNVDLLLEDELLL